MVYGYGGQYISESSMVQKTGDCGMHILHAGFYIKNLIVSLLRTVYRLA